MPLAIPSFPPKCETVKKVRKPSKHCKSRSWKILSYLTHFVSLDHTFKTQEGLLNWLVDKLPEQSLLNTASWRFIIPKLYKMYPNDDMKLNISVSSPPIITITSEGVEAVVIADMIIDVMDGDDTIPVACVSMTISANGLMDVSGNNIIGAANLQNLSLKLKWSNVGDFHMRFIQAVVQTLVKDVLLPLINVQLKKGFPLPIIRNFRVQNADVIYDESQLVVCTDVQYAI
ncbi:hypothetical protein SUGI_0992820 [Cryptomeria japonica]|nr:hypothetical protein SUGI_0992820 [Cryptomeria japonica]